MFTLVSSRSMCIFVNDVLPLLHVLKWKVRKQFVVLAVKDTHSIPTVQTTIPTLPTEFFEIQLTQA